jgi:aspartokinase
MPKIPVNGLKLSGPFAALWVAAEGLQEPPLGALYRWLTGNRVNIAYMTAGDALSSAPALCCIDRTALAKVTAMLDNDPQFRDRVRLGSDAGLLTLYPHRSSLTVLGSALQQLGEHEICIHGMASSISALSFVVPFEQLERAGDILGQGLQLPESASPMGATVQIRQEQSPE